MEKKDEYLWRIAKRRAEFKRHLMSFAAVNVFLWMLWLFTNADAFPWPIFVTLGWGMTIGKHYFTAYHDDYSLTEKEYHKLMEEKEDKDFWDKQLYKEENMG